VELPQGVEDDIPRSGPIDSVHQETQRDRIFKVESILGLPVQWKDVETDVAERPDAREYSRLNLPNVLFPKAIEHRTLRYGAVKEVLTARG
jgi:hypothetical protein